jgi:hypothetical protein
MAIVLAACGGDDEPKSRYQPLPEWDVASAQVLIKKKDKKHGLKNVEAYFVATGSPEGHHLQAKACVRALRGQYDGVECFAFPSQAAFDYSEIDPRTGKMKNVCWSARWGLVPQSDGSVVGDGMSGNVRSYYDECPSAYVPDTQGDWKYPAG